MKPLLWICLAGALGTAARHALTVWAARQFGASFPYGTLAVNLAGCFAISAVMHVALSWEWAASVRAALVTGFLGGFTTYSAFNYETLRLLQTGAALAAAANVSATLVGGLLSGWLGLLAARLLVGR